MRKDALKIVFLVFLEYSAKVAKTFYLYRILLLYTNSTDFL